MNDKDNIKLIGSPVRSYQHFQHNNYNYQSCLFGSCPICDYFGKHNETKKKKWFNKLFPLLKKTNEFKKQYSLNIIDKQDNSKKIIKINEFIYKKMIKIIKRKTFKQKLINLLTKLF